LVCDRVVVVREGRIVDEFVGKAIEESVLVRACYSDPPNASDAPTTATNDHATAACSSNDNKL
jgi:hypothetical protein